MCLCVCTSVFVRVRALTRAFANALARDCHIAGADLGLFRPVNFVVVCKTRVKVNFPAFPFKVKVKSR